MPMMHSGALVGMPGMYSKQAVPTLEDIALSLSRIPRFAGHTDGWFSVLDHSFFVEMLAVADGFVNQPTLRLALRLHDAHECITSDVPSDVKPDDMREDQKWFDVLIMDRYFPGGSHAYDALRALIKDYDGRALVTEAYVIGPPRCRELSKGEWLDLFGHEKATNRDVTLLDGLIRSGRLSLPALLHQGAKARNVCAFVQQCKDDINALAVIGPANAA